MHRRRLALLPVLAALGCSGANQETPRPAGPAPTSTVTAAPRPPRKLNGAPVVLAMRRPTKVAGVDWAWIMPEGRLATLAPAGEKGRFAILGPNFFGGPKGLYVGLEVNGDFAIAADGAVHSIGAKFELAGFDDDGEHVLLWNGTTWGLYGRDGKRLRADERYLAQASLLPDGRLVEHVSPGVTRVLSTEGEVKVRIPFACSEILPAAGRLVCTDPRGSKGFELVVFGLDGPDELGRFSGVSRSPRTSYAARADGGAIARATDTIEIFELASGKKKATARVVYRRDESARWMAPRMAFSTDGKRLCVEESAGMVILDTGASAFKNAAPAPRGPKGTLPVCFFAPRGNGSVGTTGEEREWDAYPVNVPVHEGFEEPATLPSGRGSVETMATSRDRKVGALLQRRGADEGDKWQWTVQATIVDLATGDEKRIIPLGAFTGGKWVGSDTLTTDLLEDGAVLQVCSQLLYQGACRRFSTATGAEIAGDVLARVAPARTTFQVWSGEWPEARTAETLAALSVPVETKARVVGWSDEGKYVSMEIDPGDGATVHLNMPDTPEHVVRDVVAVAGGSMLALASQGVVELWGTQPLELSAVLVETPEGGAALFADGSIEVAGKGADALGCQQGELIVPIAECGDLWAERGTLAALMKAIRNRR